MYTSDWLLRACSLPRCSTTAAKSKTSSSGLAASIFENDWRSRSVSLRSRVPNAETAGGSVPTMTVAGDAAAAATISSS